MTESINTPGPEDFLSDQEDDNNDQEEKPVIFRERRNRLGTASPYQDLVIHLKHPNDMFYQTKKMTIMIRKRNLSSSEKDETDWVQPIHIKIFFSSI